MEFDKESIPQATLKKVERYTKMENFQPAYVSKISQAAGALCMWVRSIEDFSKALKVIEPKRKKKQFAEEQLRKKLEFLEGLQTEFAKVAEKLAALERQFNETNAELT